MAIQLELLGPGRAPRAPGDVPPHAKVEIVNGFGYIPQLERPSEGVKRGVPFAERALLPG